MGIGSKSWPGSTCNRYKTDTYHTNTTVYIGPCRHMTRWESDDCQGAHIGPQTPQYSEHHKIILKQTVAKILYLLRAVQFSRKAMDNFINCLVQPQQGCLRPWQRGGEPQRKWLKIRFRPKISQSLLLCHIYLIHIFSGSAQKPSPWGQVLETTLIHRTYH